MSKENKVLDYITNINNHVNESINESENEKHYKLNSIEEIIGYLKSELPSEVSKLKNLYFDAKVSALGGGITVDFVYDDGNPIKSNLDFHNAKFKFQFMLHLSGKYGNSNLLQEKGQKFVFELNQSPSTKIMGKYGIKKYSARKQASPEKAADKLLDFFKKNVKALSGELVNESDVKITKRQFGGIKVIYLNQKDHIEIMTRSFMDISDLTEVLTKYNKDEIKFLQVNKGSINIYPEHSLYDQVKAMLK